MPDTIDIDEELAAAEEQRKREAALAMAQANDTPDSTTLAITPAAAPDKYRAYQDWLNTLNPATAQGGRIDLAAQGLDTADPFNNAPPVPQKFDPEVVQLKRLQAQDEFQRRVQAGQPAAEALMAVAPNLYAGNPEGLLKAVQPTGRRGVLPVAPTGTPRQIVNNDPRTGEPISVSILNGNGNVQSTHNLPKQTIPPDRKAGQDALKRQIDETQKEIAKDYTLANKSDADPDAKNAAARRVIIARERISDLEKQYQQGTTNWMKPGMLKLPDAPKAKTEVVTTQTPEGIDIRRASVSLPEPPKQDAQEMVSVVSPDGKTGSIPKSKLAAAQKAGYKLR